MPVIESLTLFKLNVLYEVVTEDKDIAGALTNNVQVLMIIITFS